MSHDNEILDCIYEAIRELNGQLPPEERLTTAPETVLQGEGAALDSLALINFLVLLEDGVEARLGRRVVLLDERHMAAENGPFRTVETLAAHVTSALRS